MNWWLAAIVIWLAIESGAVLGKNGQPKRDTYSFGYTVVTYAILIFLIVKAIHVGF